MTTIKSASTTAVRPTPRISTDPRSSAAADAMLSPSVSPQNDRPPGSAPARSSPSPSGRTSWVTRNRHPSARTIAPGSHLTATRASGRYRRTVACAGPGTVAGCGQRGGGCRRLCRRPHGEHLDHRGDRRGDRHHQDDGDHDELQYGGTTVPGHGSRGIRLVASPGRPAHDPHGDPHLDLDRRTSPPSCRPGHHRRTVGEACCGPGPTPASATPRRPDPGPRRTRSDWPRVTASPRRPRGPQRHTPQRAVALSERTPPPPPPLSARPRRWAS